MGDGLAAVGGHGSETHRRIVRAAEELFKKVGYRGVTMEAVADAAVVSKATLYTYFRNKDQLFLTVCSRMAELLTREVRRALEDSDRTLDDRVLAAVLAKQRLVFTLVRSSPHASDLFSHKALIAGDIFAQAEEAMLERLKEALETDACFRPSARQLARALLFGSGELAARSAGIAELESEVSAFVVVHLAGVRALASGSARARGRRD